jgi:hypothetical protein
MMAMPVFKIYRMKDSHYQHFRWAPHTTGAAQVKARDYQPAGEIEASAEYEAWAALRDRGEALRVGDLLESELGGLRICKYVGFEEAHWVVPESKPGPEEIPGAEATAGNAPTA